MLNQIIKLAVVSGVAVFLRPRWKRLSACAFAILVAAYGHSEYLEFVAALPPGSGRLASAGEYMLLAFALKNIVIGIAIIAAILPEMRRCWSKDRLGSTDESAQTRAVGMARPKIGESAPSTGRVQGDGFDFLRDGRKLSSQADRLIRDKPPA